eukprot:1300868-Heterocapsa_arctica.AAC.1
MHGVVQLAGSEHCSWIKLYASADRGLAQGIHATVADADEAVAQNPEEEHRLHPRLLRVA